MGVFAEQFVRKVFSSPLVLQVFIEFLFGYRLSMHFLAQARNCVAQKVSFADPSPLLGGLGIRGPEGVREASWRSPGNVREASEGVRKMFSTCP